MISKTLGRYRILEPLGEGGMGRVYLAEDPALGRSVAIKVLSPEFAADAAARARLLLEARSASALNHPNILTVYDLGEEDGMLYLATERIDGVRLREWAAGSVHPPAEVLAIVRQATGALAVAHAQGLVHRDLKPENLMVRRDGLLKILDFGLARSVSPTLDDTTMRMTAPGLILGTAPYMSPEQVLGQPAGPSSDVFSMGTILYELLTGRHPFVADSAVETMHRILQDSPEPPSTLVAGLPQAVDFVLAKAMARDPARRYPTARDLDLDLEACETALAAAGSRRPASPAAPAAAAPRAIAVLPFKQIGGSPEFEYLGIGLADAVITRLSTSPDLVVRPTSAIARFEKTPVEARHVARELEVSAVLDASFQRAGSRFRATARLIEEPGGRALWAGKIDLDIDDLFAVQDEVAAGIANALSARLRVEGGRHTPAPEVFALYLRAREPDRTESRAGMLHKIDLLEQAVARDPGYADAWAYLAKLQQSMIDAGHDSDESWYRRADASCRRALEIESEHSYARYTQGSLDLVRGRKREAYRAFIARHREHPNDFQPLHYIGYVLRLCNLTDRAIDVEREARDKDPSSPWTSWTIVRLLIELRRDDEAAEELERARLRFAGSPLVLIFELMLLRNRGRFEEIVERSEPRESRADDSRIAFERAYSLLRLGRRDEAEGPLRAFEPHARTDMDFAAYHAALLAWKGEVDEAFAFLARAAELGNDAVHLYERPDLYGPLHDDARWPAFLEEARTRADSYRAEMDRPLEAVAG